MNRKSLDRKFARKFTLDARENGRTDQEIYNELIQHYYDKKGVALLIAGTPTKINKEKYKIYNTILLGVIGITILFKLLFVLNLTMTTGQLWTLILIFFAPIINIYLFIEIARYSAPIYRAAAGLTILSFAQSMDKMATGVSALINVVLMISIVVLAFYLDEKLFPNYKPTSMKKDANGEYILNQ